MHRHETSGTHLEVEVNDKVREAMAIPKRFHGPTAGEQAEAYSIILAALDAAEQERDGIMADYQDLGRQLEMACRELDEARAAIRAYHDAFNHDEYMMRLLVADVLKRPAVRAALEASDGAD